MLKWVDHSHKGDYWTSENLLLDYFRAMVRILGQAKRGHRLYIAKSLIEGGWPAGEEGASVLDHTMRQRETKFGNKKLLDVWTTNVGRLLYLSDPEDLDRTESSAVTRGHVLVASMSGVDPRQLSEFLVHVVGTRARVVSKPNTKVLNLEGFLLVDDVESDDLTGCLLHFPQLTEVVPESRFSNHIVGSKDSHAVKFWPNT